MLHKLSPCICLQCLRTQLCFFFFDIRVVSSLWVTELYFKPEQLYRCSFFCVHMFHISRNSRIPFSQDCGFAHLCHFFFIWSSSGVNLSADLRCSCEYGWDSDSNTHKASRVYSWCARDTGFMAVGPSMKYRYRIMPFESCDSWRRMIARKYPIRVIPRILCSAECYFRANQVLITFTAVIFD